MRKSAVILTAVMLGAAAANAQMLPSSEWEPVEVAGEAFTPVSDIFVRFEQDGRFFGNDGCNTIRGQFLTNGEAILLGPAAATMMACPEEIMAQAQKFVEALMSARLYERDGARLKLSAADGTVALRMTQRDAD